MTNLIVACSRPGPPHDADEHVERDQHRLPEDVEEEEVLRGEDADDRSGEEQHQPVIGTRPVAADPHAVGDRGRHHHDGEADEPDREPLEHADVVGDAEILEPGQAGRLLQAAVDEVEAGERLDPETDLEEREQQGSGRDPHARHRHEPEQQRTAERQEDQDVGDPAVRVHRDPTPPRSAVSQGQSLERVVHRS